jgi:ERCC4-type nuclease
MAVQKEQDGKTVLDKSKFDVITKLANINTRVAGGSSLLQNPQLKNSEERPIIIVDMREFRSQLPCILYTRGFQVLSRVLRFV